MRISDWSSDVCSSDLHFRVHFGEQAAAATDGNLYTKTGEHLAQLNADHPTTDDQQRSGQSIKRQCCRAGEVGYGIQTWNRWNAGPCAHRQNDLAAFYRHIEIGRAHV